MKTKFFPIIVTLALFQAAAFAQSTAPAVTASMAASAAATEISAAAPPTEQNLAAQRASIAQQRTAVQTTYDAAERDCYSRFAVFDCLDEARQAQRTALDALRKQELALNAWQRQIKAAQAAMRVEQKSHSRVAPEFKASAALGAP